MSEIIYWLYWLWFTGFNLCSLPARSPILGSPTTTLNKYKEIEELAKIQYARWEQRRDVLAHPFIRVFIWKKWEKIAWVFSVARFFHVRRFSQVFFKSLPPALL